MPISAPPTEGAVSRLEHTAIHARGRLPRPGRDSNLPAPPAPPAQPGRLSARFRGWAYDTWFRTVHRHRLVYNACWEDPRIDRALLELDADSRVVMITSAGCNALDYLLDDPAEIHAIDVNPRQNALLQLKLALIQRGDFADLFQAFGRGVLRNFERVLEQCRDGLSAGSHAFWESKGHYLDGRHFKRSFYFHGSSGDVAWAMRTLVLQRCPELWRQLENLLEATSLHSQQAAFDKLEPLLWGRFCEWLVRQPMTLSLLGIPRPQTRLIQEQHPDGVLGYIKEKVRHVTTRVPMDDNYFWRVYVTGQYTEKACPSYLRPENFEILRSRGPRISTHTLLLSEFLVRHPAPYSHYVLLDHQDWLASHDPTALEEEWRLILVNSRPGTRILFRSAAPRVDFIPDFVRSRVRFAPERTDALHLQDRVGTYGSLHLAEVL